MDVKQNNISFNFLKTNQSWFNLQIYFDAQIE